MYFDIKIDNKVSSDQVDLLHAQLAYCDPSIRNFDLANIAEGLIRVDAEESADRQIIERKVRNVVNKIISAGPTPPTRVINEVDADIQWDTSVDEKIRNEKLAIPLGDGIFGITGILASLIRILDEDFREISLRLGAAEARFPSMLRAEFLKRIGYFRSFPHYTTFVTHLPGDVELLDNFIKKTANPDSSHFIPVGEMEPSSMILSPTICYHIYDAFSDTVIPEKGVLLTAEGSCYRWESSNLVHLRRLWEFSMRELVMLGSKDMVLDVREKAMEATLDYCRKLGIKAWVENANDPFFSDDAATKSKYQKGFGMKWELRLPYNAENQSISVSSFNNMQKTFGESCSIRSAGNEEVFSGCIGWGLERWAYAFLAQKGTDPLKWPEQIRKRL